MQIQADNEASASARILFSPEKTDTNEISLMVLECCPGVSNKSTSEIT